MVWAQVLTGLMTCSGIWRVRVELAVDIFGCRVPANPQRLAVAGREHDRYDLMG
jgi:hypothetical protein